MALAPNNFFNRRRPGAGAMSDAEMFKNLGEKFSCMVRSTAKDYVKMFDDPDRYDALLSSTGEPLT